MSKRHIINMGYDLLLGSGVNLSRFVILEYLPTDKIEFVFT